MYVSLGCSIHMGRILAYLPSCVKVETNRKYSSNMPYPSLPTLTWARVMGEGGYWLIEDLQNIIYSHGMSGSVLCQ